MSDAPKRNRRLRKKLYLDEFAIQGFEFACDVKEASQEEYDQFFDALVEVIGSRDLYVNLGDCDGRFYGIVTSGERYASATEEDIAAVKATLDAQAIAENVEVGGLIDAFYGERQLAK
ncbi:MAG: YggL family protein [Cellvibrionaceae bacterium]|nr:YggL family protein [Cellvibrionaceae bacterium]